MLMVFTKGTLGITTGGVNNDGNALKFLAFSWLPGDTIVVALKEAGDE